VRFISFISVSSGAFSDRLHSLMRRRSIIPANLAQFTRMILG
jgi:hypothetical protein